jgi:hypothetical protein
MRLATRSTAGDGIIDQFGISGVTDSIIFQLIATNDGLMVDESTMTYAFDDPRTMRALDFAYMIFQDRLWYYDSGADPMGDWSRNYFSFMEGRSAFFGIATWALENDRPSFEYAVIPWPQGPDGTGYNTIRGFVQGITIGTGTEMADEIFHIYEQLLSWPGEDIHLITDATYEYTRRSWLTEDDVTRVLHEIGSSDSDKFEIGLSIPAFPWVVNSWARHFLEGSMTVAQAVETYRQPQQDLIDAIFRP